MKLSFFRTSQNEISKSQQRASLSMGQARFDSTPLFVMPSRLVSDSSELAACRDGHYCDSEVKRTSEVCEIKNYITNQIKEELHAKTLTNLGTERIEFKCVCKNEIRLIN